MILAIALLLLAIVLVMLELGFPSFGILSLAAATAYAFSLVLAFKEGNTVGWTFVGLGIVLLPATIFFGLKVLPYTPMGKRLFLSGPAADEIQRGTLPAELRTLIGREGTAISSLRPAGVIEVDGRRIDVVASRGYVARGSRVRVAAASGSRVIVDPVDTESDFHGVREDT